MSFGRAREAVGEKAERRKVRRGGCTEKGKEETEDRRIRTRERKNEAKDETRELLTNNKDRTSFRVF